MDAITTSPRLLSHLDRKNLPKGFEEADLDLIRKMRNQRVFEDFRTDQIGTTKGLVWFTCGDCDRFRDMYQHITQMCKKLDNSCPHCHANNGGALLLDRDTPIPDGKLGREFLLQQLRGTHGLKKLDKVALYMHWPCGMALTYKMSFVDSLRVHLRGKQQIREECPGVEPIGFCHVDYGLGVDNKTHLHRTYHITRNRWIDFCNKEGMDPGI